MKNCFLTIFILCSLTSIGQISFTNLSKQPPDNITSILADTSNNDIYVAAAFKIIRSVNNYGVQTHQLV